MNDKACNPNATQEVKDVLSYLHEISGNGIITGQHTKTKAQEELTYINKVTGKRPALCGFELLAYSPNINYEESDDACLKEVNENKNTLEEAWKWADKKGLITFTWHWFSPLGGSNKAFYSEHTDFDAREALKDGTPENKAFISDMDHMADILKDFQDKKIPILWRPFHESEGTWFWWGKHGPQIAKELYRKMYDRYTNYHKLNNLIWVWNSPLREGYVGDDVCDVISYDFYPPKHEHNDRAKEYHELISITPTEKLVAIGEIGPIPSIEDLSRTRLPWLWYMTWCGEFCSEEYTLDEELKNAYHHPYAITLDTLPELY